MRRLLVVPATVLLLATGLSACAPVPRLGAPPRPAAMPQSDRALGAEATGSWPDDRWWQRYGDPQLDALEAEALAGSPTFAAAFARIRRADAVAEQAGSALIPEVAADGSLSQTKQSYNNGPPRFIVPKGFHDNTRATIGFNWDADLWGRNRDSLAAATSEAQAVRADAAQARLALTTSLAAAYVDLSRLFTDRDSAAAAAKVRQDTLALTAARRANGLETEGIVSQSLAADRSAQSDVVAIDESIAITRTRIAALLGAGPDRGLAITRPALRQATPQPLPDRLGIDLVARRPDIAARLWRLAAAARRVRAARKDFYPNLTLSGLAGAQSLDLRNIASNGSEIASLGLAIHLPLFSPGRIQGAYRAQRADYDAAVADYDGALVGAVQDVANALATRRTIATRIGQLQAALAASTRAHEVARARYEEGLTSYLGVLTAEDQMIATRRALNALLARGQSADIDLIRALGGDYRAPASPEAGSLKP
jgi:NodT family efflux transporter outer membrane factor (OMF) lipoprotein